MGRTGRRAGIQRNCLFLATSDDALLQAAALIDLWASGFVEPIVPPPLPLHVLAQQLMALALQESGIGRDAWRDWAGSMPAFAALSVEEVATVIDHMVSSDILWDDEGILWFGRKGEEEYGHRNFMELLSMITSEPLFAVRYGRSELGYVHQLSFATQQGRKTTLLLAGRSWQVNHLDWQRKVAYVEPAREVGRSRWVGSGQPLSFAMSRAIRRVLATDEVSNRWSRRAQSQIEVLRQETPWIRQEGTVMLTSGGACTWWTFAGSRANAAIAASLTRHDCRRVEHDNLSITMDSMFAAEELHSLIEAVRSEDAEEQPVPVSDEAVEQLKFSSCLPPHLATRLLQMRLADHEAVRSSLAEQVRYVS